MATGTGIEGVEGSIRRLFGDGSASGLDAGDLLRRFASDSDPVALEVLVARHGPMVLGVCRRVLGDRHASDDAFQATFLILARKAGAIRDPDRLGPWLHGVAHRVAVRARADLARRQARERPGAEDLAMARPADEAGFDRLELRAALDEEVRRLPEKFRDPIVLCYLDGLTHDEAATRLRCPVGTVRSRLSTGRARLRDRLTRRGVEVPSSALAAAISAEAAPGVVSPALLTSTVKAATAFAAGLTGATAAGVVPAAVASLAEGVSTTMILSKLKMVTALALAGMMTVGVGGVAAYQAGGPGQEPKAEKPADEKPESLMAKLQAKAEESKAQAEQMKADLAKLQAELQDALARIKELEKKAGSSGMGGVGAIGMGMAGGSMGTNNNNGGRGGIGGGAMSMPGAMAGGWAPARMSPAPGGTDARTAARNRAAAKNSKRPLSFRTDDFIIVEEPDRSKLEAYSTETGQWASYEPPKGTTVVPIYSAGVVALMLKGDEIRQVATYVPKAGQWFPIDLKEPAHGEAMPIVGSSQAVYAIGRRVYAFSVLTKSWDVLELPEGTKPTPIVYNSMTTVDYDDRVAIFGVGSGKWTDLDFKAGQVEMLRAK